MTSFEFIGNLMRVEGYEDSSHPILINVRNVIAFSGIYHVQANDYYKTERWAFHIYLSHNTSGDIYCHFETKAKAEKAWGDLEERLEK